MKTSISPSAKCQVCGDKAQGYNYNGLTCVSCRTFFIRSSFKFKFLKCPKAGSCPIDIATRKSCSKCRLVKCFSIGMKIKNFHKNESPQQRKKISGNYNENINIHKLNDNFMESEIKQALGEDEENDALEMIQQDYSATLQADLDLSTSRRLTRNYALGLSNREREIIGEIQSASAVFVDEQNLPEVRQTNDLFEILSWPRVYARRIIKFCKSIKAFRLLNQEDQLEILKPFYLQVLVIRMVFIYDHIRNGYSVMEDESGTKAIFVCLDVHLERINHKEVDDNNRKFFITLKNEMENDSTIRDLIMGQFLFRKRKNISCPEFIRHQYFVYCHVLRRYLEHKYKNLKAAISKFSSFINLLNDLDATIEKSRVAFDHVNCSKFDDLLIELYDLVN